MKITSLEELHALVVLKKAVTCNAHCFRRHIPAAFMIHLQGTILISLMKSGMYEYRKQELAG